MSKFLVQSKTYLPMVIQKSTTDIVKAAKMVETHHTSLPLKPLNQVDEHVPADTPHGRGPEANENIVLKSNLELSKEMSAIQNPQLSLFEALLLDLVQLQQRLMLFISQRRLWLSGHSEGLLRAAPDCLRSQAHLLWLEGGPRVQPRVEAPPLVLDPQHGRGKSVRPVQKQHEVAPPLRSNLWDSVQQRAPAWQQAIATKLGAMQKSVVQKLSK